jgi:TRAP-type C4-dicarboxylate transport system substrate-binding protein
MKLFAAQLLISCVCFAQTAPIQINLGTVAPEGSPWHTILQRTRDDWSRISGKKISVRIYAGGVLGDELDMLRKTRLGQLHAVALSGVGLAHVEPALACLAVPMLLESYDEFDYVRARIVPKLEALIEKKGFVVLQWSDVGWVRFFTKAPVRTPDDLRKQKLYTAAGDPEAEKLYREFGMQVVPLSISDLLPSLQTNLIQAFNVPPLFALLDQSFALAKNMLDVRWAALTGATLVSRKQWDRIPVEQQRDLLKASRGAAERSRAEIRKMGADAVVEMQKRGLRVTSADAAALALWRGEAERAYPRIRGRLVPAELFDEAVRLRDEFRNKRSKL